VALVPVEIDSTTSVRKQIDASQEVMTKLLDAFVGCEGLFKITDVGKKLCQLEQHTEKADLAYASKYVRQHLPHEARNKIYGNSPLK
jgi:hypothetical protein